MGETQYDPCWDQIPLYLWTCEMRPHYLNGGTDIVYNSYRHYHSRKEKMEGIKESPVPSNFKIQKGKFY